MMILLPLLGGLRRLELFGSAELLCAILALLA